MPKAKVVVDLPVLISEKALFPTDAHPWSLNIMTLHPLNALCWRVPRGHVLGVQTMPSRA